MLTPEEKIVILLGYMGRMLVFVGIACVCALIWTLIIRTMF